MVFIEGDEYRELRRPGDDPAQFRALKRFGRISDFTVTDGLKAWYRFESGGGVAVDSATSQRFPSIDWVDDTAYDGTVIGGSQVSTPAFKDAINGINSTGLGLDGVDDAVITSPNPLDTTTDVTVMTWVNPDTSNLSRIINTNDNDNGFRLLYDNEAVDSGTFGTIFEDSGATDTFSVSPSVPVGDITQISVSLNSVTDEATLGTNGKDRETIPTKGSGSDPVNMEIGGSPSLNREFFDGTIFETRVYERTLTETVRTDIFNNVIV
jgi:hypothetical protein